MSRRILRGKNERKPLPSNREPSLLERAAKNEPPTEFDVEKGSRETKFLGECELKSSTKKVGIKIKSIVLCLKGFEPLKDPGTHEQDKPIQTNKQPAH